MRKTMILFVIPLLLSISSCSFLVLHLTGMRQPKEETLNEIKDYAVKWEQDTNEMYVLKDSASFRRIYSVQPYTGIFANAQIYTRNGKIRQFRDSSSCQWSSSRFIAKMKPDSAYEVIPVRDWELIFQDIVPLTEGGATPSFDTSRYDFLVIYTWAIFLHKYNERQFRINKAVSENPYARIKMIQVNMDIQKSWNLSKDNWLRLSATN